MNHPQISFQVWDLLEGRDWSSAACKVTMVGHVKIVRCLQVFIVLYILLVTYY